MRFSRALSLCCIIIFIGTGNPFVYTQEGSLSHKIAALLKDSYDHKMVDSPAEKFLLIMGRHNYFRILDLWANTYPVLDAISYTPDPSVIWLEKRMKNDLTKEELAVFEGYFLEIQYLTIANFTMYFEAVKMYNVSEDNYCTLSCEQIDACLAHEYFKRMQKDLYKKEREITQKIQAVLSDERVASKLVVERALFKFIISMRNRTIDRLLGDDS